MSRMYELSRMQWNPFVGCHFGCKYCKKSFQCQLKRRGKKDMDCYNFIPHCHPERLNRKFLRTEGLQFIFTVATGDISFCPPDFLEHIFETIRKNADRTFLIQTKNPGAFKSTIFPENIILGTTLETNRVDEYEGVSLAPLPEQRFKDILSMNHPKKMLTLEPIIDFDTEIMKSWIRAVQPEMVWIGYDSRKSGLIEPEKQKVEELISDLINEKFQVIPKLIRERHLI